MDTCPQMTQDAAGLGLIDGTKYKDDSMHTILHSHKLAADPAAALAALPCEVLDSMVSIVGNLHKLPWLQWPRRSYLRSVMGEKAGDLPQAMHSFPSNAAHAASRIQEAHAADPSADLAAVISTSDSAVTVTKTNMVSIHRYIQVCAKAELNMCMLTYGPSFATGYPFPKSASLSYSQLSSCSARSQIHESVSGACICGC